MILFFNLTKNGLLKFATLALKLQLISLQHILQLETLSLQCSASALSHNSWGVFSNIEPIGFILKHKRTSPYGSTAKFVLPTSHLIAETTSSGCLKNNLYASPKGRGGEKF